MGLHPKDHWDQYTIEDIHQWMIDSTCHTMRGELLKFWGVRHQCPICQSAITQSAEVFAEVCGMLYDQLSGIDKCFDKNHHDQIVKWAEDAYERAETKPVNFDGFPLLEINPTTEEVSREAIRMLVPFDFATEMRRMILDAMPHWIEGKRLEAEWQGVLESEKIRPALVGLAENLSQFEAFFTSVASLLGLEYAKVGTEEIFHMSSRNLALGDTFTRDKERTPLRILNNMAIKLLIKFKEQTSSS